MWIDLGNIALGMVLLLLGNDSFAHGVTGWAARCSKDALAIAWGSSVAAALVPGAALIIAAHCMQQPELAFGAVVGASIANLGVSLALAALVAPLLARLKSLALLNLALLGAVVLVWLLGVDGLYARMDGGILLAAFVLVAILFLRSVRRERAASRPLFERSMREFGTGMLVARCLLGALLLGLGSWRLVMGGSALASHLAWNPLIVGMLVLGLALALAGLPNALASARRGHGEFALGQALYASMASLLFLLGAVLLWQPMASVPSLMRFELPALFALAAATYPMMRSDGALSGREGGILLAAWLLFVAAELWLTFA